MIEIVATGPLNTVQDLGRPGYRNIGVTACGAMDTLALRIGNVLVGNPPEGAGIEVQTFPFRVRFSGRTVFALTGADCRATLDGVPLPPWWTTEAQPGQMLELSPPVKDARAYLCLAGGVDVAPVMGSRSTRCAAVSGEWAGARLPRMTGSQRAWRRLVFCRRAGSAWCPRPWH